MRYSFNDFVFDSEQLLLFKQNEMIPCRPNEAKLLALFLAEPQTVLGKEDILDRVWAGKVVSEQAVFQSISNLRSLFGEAAIKTFPKKGYQWQLDVCVIDASLSPAPHALALEKNFFLSSNRNRKGLLLLLTLALFVCASILFYLFNKHHDDSPKIAVWPLLIDPQNKDSVALQTELINPLWIGLLASGKFDAIAVAQNESYSDLFYLPEKYTYLSERKKNSAMTMMAAVGQRKDKVFVRYLLKINANLLTAEIEANTQAQLMEQWLKHLAHLASSHLVSVNSADPVLMNAELKLLHHNYPDDLVILYSLGQSQLDLGNITNALVLAEQLRDKAQLQQDNLYLGYALLLWGKALQQQELWSDSEQKFQQALTLFKDAQNYRLANEVQQALSQSGLDSGNYEQMKAWNLQAIESARLAKDYLLEVRSTDLLAIWSLKFGDHQVTDAFLKQAEALLDKHNQPRVHYAMIYFHSGMSAQDPAEAEYHYRRVLDITQADPELWVRERAQAHLVQLLIFQKRWQDAFAIYANQNPLMAPQELMLAQIYQAQQEWSKAEEHTVATFKQANNKGDRYLALDAALALIGIYQQQHLPEKQTRYKKFIAQESIGLAFWQKQNKAALDEFGIRLNIQ